MTNAHEEPQDALRPGETERIITVELDAETLEGLYKKAESKQYGGFTMFSDEGFPGKAPPPMGYFAAAILF